MVVIADREYLFGYGVAICFPFHGLMAILDLHVKMRAQQLMRITEISSDGR